MLGWRQINSGKDVQMNVLKSKRTLAVAGALALGVGAGGAIAASKGSTTSGNGFLARVAGHLGISTQKLEDATKAAAIDQVDADLEAGRITKAQADEMKARINAGGVPLFFGGPHRFGELRSPPRPRRLRLPSRRAPVRGGGLPRPDGAPAPAEALRQASRWPTSPRRRASRSTASRRRCSPTRRRTSTRR